MADPLLTSLCAICHLVAPKYKCPRCSIQTCSLACIKKHKAWSDCTGERDATAYVSRTRLRTAAGIDHDYNFLHGMERSMERAERVAVHDRGIVQEAELHPLTVQEVRWRVGKDGRRRRVVTTRALREAKGRSMERQLAQRLKRLRVTVLCVAAGMARAKENNTSLNRRSGRINWQVEWLAFTGENTDEGLGATTRLLCKTMDDVPLHQAYRNALDEQTRTHKAKKASRYSREDHLKAARDPAWHNRPDTLQDPYTGAWISHQGADMDMWPSERDDIQQGEFQFFLAKPFTRANQPTEVTRISSKESLRTTLAHTRVLEFPTIYVLPSDGTLPAGFVLGPKDIVPPTQQQQGTKRKGGDEDVKGNWGAKKRKQGVKEELEEGEVGSGDDEKYHSEDDSKPVVGLEAGEVLDEQSLEEEDDDGSEDDSTSSSGSDSE